MPSFIKVILAFIVGLIAGEAIPIIGYIIATNVFGFHDHDGGGAMGAIFMLGPLCALICGSVLAVIFARRAG